MKSTFYHAEGDVLFGTYANSYDFHYETLDGFSEGFRMRIDDKSQSITGFAIDNFSKKDGKEVAEALIKIRKRMEKENKDDRK